MSNQQYPRSVLIAYSTKGKADAFTVNASAQVQLYNARAFNNSGGSAEVAICRKLINSQFQYWRATSGGTVFTDSSAAIQAGTATQLFSGVINDGFVVQGAGRFNMIGFTISTNQSGGVYTYQYWNGSAYATLTTLEVPANYNTAADTWITFRAPQDWVAGGTGVESTRYSIKVISTTAPAGAVSINSLWVATFLEHYSGVSNNSAVQLSFPDTKPYVLHGGETLIPYFSVAAAANAVGIYYDLG